MVGTLRFAHPTIRGQFHLSGKSLKTCPALSAKIFRLTPRPNQRHNSARLTHRGALAIVTDVRWDAMDAKRAQASGREAYGEVVWFGRRGAGVKLAGNVPPATEAKEPFSGESTK
jgi:hypothetical protein